MGMENCVIEVYTTSMEKILVGHHHPKGRLTSFIDLTESNDIKYQELRGSTGYQIKCMICDSTNGTALEWKTTRKDEKGAQRIICMDCIFENAEDKTVKKFLKEDPCVDNSNN